MTADRNTKPPKSSKTLCPVASFAP